MKLYYFRPEDYGEEALVLAESLEKAKEYLLKTIGQNPDEDRWDREYHETLIKTMVNLRDGYTVEEYGIGEVVFTEIS